MNILCLFGFHDWETTEAKTLVDLILEKVANNAKGNYGRI